MNVTVFGMMTTVWQENVYMLGLIDGLIEGINDGDTDGRTDAIDGT
jgi:hypothetical protein